MPTETARVVFIHGRPDTHPNRLPLLRAINADFLPVDFRLPWAHRPDPPKSLMALSLAVCALRFPNRKRYHLFLGDGPQFLPIAMKLLGRLGRRQKIVPYVADQMPYFLATGWFGPRKTRLLRAIFNLWDGYLCVGEVMEQLTRQVTRPGKHPGIFTIPNYLRRDRYELLRGTTPKLDSPSILFVGNGPSGHRVWYKGLDLMLEAFGIACRENPRLRFTIVGEWTSAVAGELLRRVGRGSAERVRFVGQDPGIQRYMAESGLYLHCGRGDGWPNTVMEAMCAGLPPLISEWTGGREAVRQVDPELVVPLDPEAVAKRICWYLDLSLSEKKALSDRCRQVCSDYTEELAVPRFVGAVRRILHHFGLPDLPGEGMAGHDRRW
jgi:glycosyltransferase involved in cell wall biosynthesis